MIRRFLRWLGLPIHKGWKATHRSGWNKRCIGCGEHRMAYQRGLKFGADYWWETTESGDGSCGNIAELPPRGRP